VIPLDTSPEAFVAQARALRRLTMEERLAKAMALCDDLRRIVVAGRSPGFGDGRVNEDPPRPTSEDDSVRP
jgi:hypothetical protein